MKQGLAACGSVLAAALSLAGAAPARSGDAHAAREAQCRAWAATAFPSGLDEVSCRFEFALPSPFLFVCARGQDRGYDSDLQRAACADFFTRAADRARAGYVRPVPGAAPSEG
jgi:hypothetical protein